MEIGPNRLQDNNETITNDMNHMTKLHHSDGLKADLGYYSDK